MALPADASFAGGLRSVAVLVYHSNDRCEALFEYGALVEPTRFIR